MAVRRLFQTMKRRRQDSNLRPQLAVLKPMPLVDWHDGSEAAEKIAALMYPTNPDGPHTLPELIRRLEQRLACLRRERMQLQAELAQVQHFERFKP